MKRLQPFLVLMVILVILGLGACGWFPEKLHALEKSLVDQGLGDAEAWRVGKDVVVVDLAHSPVFRFSPTDINATGLDIAVQALEHVDRPVSSLSITFHEAESTDDPGTMHQLIYVVHNGELQQVDL